jgi:RecA-family ATPase
LVVFDTLSRSMGNGDENGPDMAHFVDRVIHLASQRFMSALIVHHTNASGSRERGHTAFRANLDAMFSCTPEKNGDGRIVRIALKNNKQKDDAEAETIYVAPSDQVTASLIFVETTPPERKEKGAGAPKQLDKVSMLAVLAQHPDGLTFKEWLLASRVPKRTFIRRIRILENENEAYKEDGRYYTSPTVEDLAGLEDSEE